MVDGTKNWSQLFDICTGSNTQGVKGRFKLGLAGSAAYLGETRRGRKKFASSFPCPCLRAASRKKIRYLVQDKRCPSKQCHRRSTCQGGEALSGFDLMEAERDLGSRSCAGSSAEPSTAPCTPATVRAGVAPLVPHVVRKDALLALLGPVVLNCSGGMPCSTGMQGPTGVPSGACWAHVEHFFPGALV